MTRPFIEGSVFFEPQPHIPKKQLTHLKAVNCHLQTYLVTIRKKNSYNENSRRIITWFASSGYHWQEILTGIESLTLCETFEDVDFLWFGHTDTDENRLRTVGLRTGLYKLFSH